MDSLFKGGPIRSLYTTKLPPNKNNSQLIGPLQLAIHVVQNPHAGEQKSLWDKTNKGIHNFKRKFPLFVLSQCDFCSPVRRFYTTWMASCKGPIEWICGLTGGSMTLFTLIFMLCTAQNSQHSNCNLWVTVYRHKTFRFYTTVSQRANIINLIQTIMEDQVYPLWLISSSVMKLLFETRDIWVLLY